MSEARSDCVHAVVITYNASRLTMLLLDDLVGGLVDIPGSVVTVFDNASTDDTVEQIRSHRSDVELIVSPSNLGFGRAVNAATKGVEARWILLINPDARIDPGSIRRLVDVARERPGHGLYGGRFVDDERQTAEDSVALVPTLTHLLAFATGFGAIARRLHLRSASARAAAASDVTEVVALPGTFLLVETDLWRELGGFDPRFFMYSEDVDLSLRVGRSGRRPLYVPQASIRHAGGASSSSGQKEVLKLTALVTFGQVWWTPTRRRCGQLLLLFGVLLRRVARVRAHTPNGRWETAWRERRRWLAGW
jgi:GT2 family glycosyltransferase